jgi:hypothetical protein
VNVPPSVLTIVRRLADLRGRVVFVVGAIRGLLITDPGAPAERPTDDVDVVVELTSRGEFYRFGYLDALGFQVDPTPGAPMCRRIVEGVRVDVMPTDGSILGFSNRWYSEAIAHAIELEAEGHRFRVVDASHFCATKLEAFADRGQGDFFHHDLEDVLAVVDGRAELVGELAATGTDVRRFVAQGLQDLLADGRFLEALPGHLGGDAASQGRLELVLGRLHALASLG